LEADVVDIIENKSRLKGFSEQWEERYKANEHLSIWPWSDLISLVMGHARPCGKDFRILELGCGAGANIPFFLQLGADYYAVEGSRTIVHKLLEKYDNLQGKIMVGDFTENIEFPGEFDLIVDRAAVTSNAAESIKKCLGLVHSKLKDNGKFIGVTWYSTLHTEYGNGLPEEDGFTRHGFTAGPFANVGRVHFSDKEHLHSLFAEFKVVLLEHKIIRQEYPPNRYINASWNLVMEKNSQASDRR
jgi:SAM-dependent methyltransferase